MKLTKKIALTFLFICSIIVLTIAFLSFNTHFDIASADYILKENNIATLDVFENQKIEDSGYLYNYDDSADYIYLDFVGDSGYAIFANETMELLEYSLSGSFPYERISAERMYYGGPNQYLEKRRSNFINAITDEVVNHTENENDNKAQSIRNVFSIKSTNYNISTPVNIETKLKAIKSLNSQKLLESPSDPPLDENNWISPTTGANYIKNSDYFLTKGSAPRHGNNTQGTCTAVAIQLMLSYNNYYNDRRIIAPEHLFGDWNASVNNDPFNSQNYAYPNQNPNVCANMSLKSSELLGSNQAYHDYLVNNGVTGWVSEASKNLRPLLNLRNIDYTIDEKHNSTNKIIESTNILNNLRNNCPVVLATSSTLNGADDFNHAVIAYGYQTFAPYQNNTQSYLGYIVHLGWDSYGNGNKINIWTNSSWYYCYMSLHINHTHSYDTFIADNEARCSVCGHRLKALNVKEIESGLEITSLLVPFCGGLVIPTTINGTTVTSIGESAFYNQENLTSIILPNTLTSIGRSAFMSTPNLTEINSLENSNITDIGIGAFYQSGIRQFIMPKLVRKIDMLTFAESNLHEIVFPEGSVLNTIGNNAFASCSSLSTCNIPASVTDINSYAFQNCAEAYLSFKSGSKLQNIGACAFLNCAKMPSFTGEFKELTAIGSMHLMVVVCYLH